MPQQPPLLRHVIRIAVVLTMLSGMSAINAMALTAPPSNDNYANAQSLVGASGVVVGANVDATQEPLEPDHAFNSAGASVWYVWQAPADGRYTFTTFGSSFNTVLAVYSGATFPGINVAFNDNDPHHVPLSPCGAGGASSVSFNAVAGIVYHIAVDSSKANGPGNIKLRWGRSATISGKITNANGGSFLLQIIRLEGSDACRDTETPGQNLFTFTDVPIGGSYNIFFQHEQGLIFTRWGTEDSISPLTGDVSNFNYFLISPVGNISGKVTVPPGEELKGISVKCVASGEGLTTATATVSATTGDYTCVGLSVFAAYVVTPSKDGFSFSPPNKTIPLNTLNQEGNFNISNVNFSGTGITLRTISGRVTNSSGGTGVSGVSVALSGSQTASSLTDSNGNYSFTVPGGGNYTVTPSLANLTFAPGSLSFSNLAANQTADFTAIFLLQLILDDAGQVAALDSVLLTRDPFPIVNVNNVLNSGADRNTRVTIFVANFALNAGELPSSVKIDLVGSNMQTYEISAEDVRPTSNPTFTQITFRLPNDLSGGTCTLAVKAHGVTSNLGSIKIATN